MKCGAFHEMRHFSYEKHCAFHEKHHISWKAPHFMKSTMLFIWKAPEIIKNSWFNTHLPFGSGLSQRTEVRPTSCLIGLSKNERPILDHHAKAHNFEIQQISCGFHVKSSRFHMKSLVIGPTLHSSNWRVFAETLAFIILGGFNRWNLGEIHQISWVKSTGFQGEICQISWVKSAGFRKTNCQEW